MDSKHPTRGLQGHKLLILVPWKPKPEYLTRLKELHPNLAIVCHQTTSFGSSDLPEGVSADFWHDVTILLTWRCIPSPQIVPKLEYVQLLSAGCNQILDKPLYTESDVAFCTANGVHGPQIAEWVIATFLAHQHHLPEYLNAMKDGNWIESNTDEDVEDAVKLRMGILGYGSIGRQCARLATALGMEVYAFTQRERATPEARRDDSYHEPGLGDPEGALPSRWFSGATQAAVDDFLAQDLDVLVVAMPLTGLTRGMIAAPQFRIMGKKKTFLSNVGRGAIVDTDDLVAALNEGLIKGVALDVTEPEPLPKEHPLWKMENVIITPHVSGNSNHYNERVLAILEYNLQRMSEGKDLVNRVDKELGY